MEFFTITVLAWFVGGVAAAIIAGTKGRSGCGFLILGALLGPIALAIALIIEPLPPEPSDYHKARERAQWRDCPRCAEQIKTLAVVCKHCGHEMQPDDTTGDSTA